MFATGLLLKRLAAKAADMALLDETRLPLWLPPKNESANTVLFINVGSWFSAHQLKKLGVFDELKSEFEVNELYRRTLAHVFELLRTQFDGDVIWRSMISGHQGVCRGVYLESFGWTNYRQFDSIVLELLESHSVSSSNVDVRRQRQQRMSFLDLFEMTEQRSDAHPGSFASKSVVRDCLHFCNPGLFPFVF